MNEETQPLIASVAMRPVEACGRCGRPGAAKFGDELICDDCYVACGSCCAEWFEEDVEPGGMQADSFGQEARNG